MEKPSASSSSKSNITPTWHQFGLGLLLVSLIAAAAAAVATISSACA